MAGRLGGGEARRGAAFVLMVWVSVAGATGCSSAPGGATADARGGALGDGSPGGLASGDADGAGGDGGLGLSPGQIDQVAVGRDPAAGIPAATLQGAVAANNAFAFELYAQLLGDGGGLAGEGDAESRNVLTSPLSASLALTMAYAGAAGATATEMASVLHADLPDGGSIFDGQNALTQALAGRPAAALAEAQQIAPSDGAAPSPSDYQLEVVNSVWGDESVSWSQDYLTRLARSYGAGVHLEDFIHAPDQACSAINAWVSLQTDGLIPDLLSPTAITSHTRFVLVNALHLNFPWVAKFDPSMTAPASFTRADGSTVTATFMNQTSALPYADDGQAQIVELAMMGGEALVVALPHAGSTLAAYEAYLETNASPLPQPSQSQNVALSIPKISLPGTTFSLAAALEALGLPLAFVPGGADFSRMSVPPSGSSLYISDVVQQATWSMQENGLQAAAATAVIGYTDDIAFGQPPPPIPVTVNRPYLIEIVDAPTGAILFLGHVEDPTAQASARAE